ncbi:MAG: hypothetical protein WCT42_04450, partial [Candidatus Paceibacterota bacterium]
FAPMIVCITHVKVGHRQTPYKANAPPEMVGRFAFRFTDSSQKNWLKKTSEIDLRFFIECIFLLLLFAKTIYFNFKLNEVYCSMRIHSIKVFYVLECAPFESMQVVHHVPRNP